ncbi:hypothetical protein HMPREF0373_02607 [Eubacterium ramulus ATCC 29099]|uniref:Uncharacterized protein n=1 Tax=Eubacterium ramulus ATCC 29099 TaxID=1256908 RepID=U2NY49_EUBRA|nr:hypothetical protein HMPREF0373_02607 [Eubacterium ramulus ATCC 29099]
MNIKKGSVLYCKQKCGLWMSALQSAEAKCFFRKNKTKTRGNSR